MILAGLLGALLSVTLLIIWPHSVPILWIGVIGTGISMASLFPTMLVMTERRMQMTSKVMSWFFVGAGLGGMFLPWLIGQFFVDFGPQISTHLILADLLLVLLVSIVVIKFPKRQAEAEP